jgi:hypothetical protein
MPARVQARRAPLRGWWWTTGACYVPPPGPRDARDGKVAGRGGAWNQAGAKGPAGSVRGSRDRRLRPGLIGGFTR